MPSYIHWRLLLTITFPFFFVSLLIWLRFEHPSLLDFLGQEDSLFENLQAAFFLLAGVQTFWAYRCSLWKKEKITAWTSLALTFFFALLFLEEISWGQRIFNWRSHDFFQNNNYQRETNLHNLSISQLLDHFLMIVGILILFITSIRKHITTLLPERWNYLHALLPHPKQATYFGIFTLIYFLYLYPRNYNWNWLNHWWIEHMNKAEIEAAELLFSMGITWIIYEYWKTCCQRTTLPPSQSNKDSSSQESSLPSQSES